MEMDARKKYRNIGIAMAIEYKYKKKNRKTLFSINKHKIFFFRFYFLLFLLFPHIMLKFILNNHSFVIRLFYGFYLSLSVNVYPQGGLTAKQNFFLVFVVDFVVICSILKSMFS